MPQGPKIEISHTKSRITRLVSTFNYKFKTKNLLKIGRQFFELFEKTLCPVSDTNTERVHFYFSTFNFRWSSWAQFLTYRNATYSQV